MRVTLDLLHELTNTRIFGLFHNCMWQSRHPEVDVSFLTLCGRHFLTRSASTFSSVSLSLSKRSTEKLIFSQPSKKRVSISWALERDICSVVTGRPCSVNWIQVWLGAFCLSSNFRTQFLHPIISQGNLRRRPKWFKNCFVYDFSSFHLDSFRDTISWECFVKNDGVRSRLIEL